jgi:hypothetical protein
MLLIGWHVPRHWQQCDLFGGGKRVVCARHQPCLAQRRVQGETVMKSDQRSMQTSQQAGHPSRSVVAVSEHPERPELLDALLVNGNDYDSVYVESVAAGYSRIKEVTPDLIVFMGLDDAAVCQLLTLLKLDGDTSEIPVDRWGTSHWMSDFEDIVPDVNWDPSCHIIAVQAN